MLDQFTDRRSRSHLFGRKPIDVAIARVAEHDLAFGVVDDNPERQVVDCLFEQARSLGARRPGRRFVGVPHTPSPAASRLTAFVSGLLKLLRVNGFLDISRCSPCFP
jgi:hypothetical protein